MKLNMEQPHREVFEDLIKKQEEARHDMINEAHEEALKDNTTIDEYEAKIRELKGTAEAKEESGRLEVVGEKIGGGKKEIPTTIMERENEDQGRLMEIRKELGIKTGGTRIEAKEEGMDRVLDMAEVYDPNNPDKNPQMQGMALNKEQLRQLFFSMPDAVEMLDKIFSGNYSTDKIFELVGELNDKYFRNKEISGRYFDVRFPEAPNVSSFRMKIYKADDGTIEACSFSVSR